MSVERTPPRPQSMERGNEPVNICSICSESLQDDQNCVIIQGCSHIFHKVCLETALTSSMTCPLFTDSPKLTSGSKNYPNASSHKPFKARGRGGKVYNTRINAESEPTRNHSAAQATNVVDYNYINQMIETTMTRLLSSLNILALGERHATSNDRTS
ncbi:uncharacterized protein LOC133334224, partial [Musca vetustissima]|uniref:uncharacterized protein LOC133334224 n=1 Tax=Musca vetustissima TaxID=27455 RepID=UPI002AB7AB53